MADDGPKVEDLKVWHEPWPAGGFVTHATFRVGDSRRSSKYGEWVAAEEVARRTAEAVRRAERNG